MSHPLKHFHWYNKRDAINQNDWISNLWHYLSFWDKNQPCRVGGLDGTCSLSWLIHHRFGLSGLTYISPPLCACKHSLQYKSGFGFGQMVEHFSVYAYIRAPNHVSKLLWFEMLCLYMCVFVFVGPITCRACASATVDWYSLGVCQSQKWTWFWGVKLFLKVIKWW